MAAANYIIKQSSLTSPSPKLPTKPGGPGKPLTQHWRHPTPTKETHEAYRNRLYDLIKTGKLAATDRARYQKHDPNGCYMCLFTKEAKNYHQ